jgi:hypothetical protein
LTFFPDIAVKSDRVAHPANVPSTMLVLTMNNKSRFIKILFYIWFLVLSTFLELINIRFCKPKRAPHP